jgi:hypothetical protein
MPVTDPWISPAELELDAPTETTLRDPARVAAHQTGGQVGA